VPHAGTSPIWNIPHREGAPNTYRCVLHPTTTKMPRTLMIQTSNRRPGQESGYWVQDLYFVVDDKEPLKIIQTGLMCTMGPPVKRFSVMDDEMLLWVHMVVPRELHELFVKISYPLLWGLDSEGKADRVEFHTEHEIISVYRRSRQFLEGKTSVGTCAPLTLYIHVPLRHTAVAPFNKTSTSALVFWCERDGSLANFTLAFSQFDCYAFTPRFGDQCKHFIW
jgi:hypothetical protein